jgi:hypothetical protein
LERDFINGLNDFLGLFAGFLNDSHGEGHSIHGFVGL